jgi:ribosomal protein S6--L-glutamate ligase
MKCCILGPKNRGKEEIWLLEEAKKVFNKVLYVSIPSARIEIIEKTKVLYKNVDLEDFDCIIPRIPRTYMNYGFVISRLLHDRVYMPNTPESIIITHNKFLTLTALCLNSVPIPKTYLASSSDAVQSLLDETKYPIVIKLLYGSRGKGVMFADSKGSAVSLIDTIESMRHPIFIEEYIGTPGEDIRAVVVGKEVVASMKRIGKKGDRRANIGAGGTAEKINISKELRDLAVKTAEVLGLGIAGVDIIETKTGPKIIEANVNVNFEGITKATGINVAKHMVDFVKKETAVFEKNKAVGPE